MNILPISSKNEICVSLLIMPDFAFSGRKCFPVIGIGGKDIVINAVFNAKDKDTRKRAFGFAGNGPLVVLFHVMYILSILGVFPLYGIIISKYKRLVNTKRRICCCHIAQT